MCRRTIHVKFAKLRAIRRSEFVWTFELLLTPVEFPYGVARIFTGQFNVMGVIPQIRIKDLHFFDQ